MECEKSGPESLSIYSAKEGALHVEDFVWLFCSFLHMNKRYSFLPPIFCYRFSVNRDRLPCRAFPLPGGGAARLGTPGRAGAGRGGGGGARRERVPTLPHLRQHRPFLTVPCSSAEVLYGSGAILEHWERCRIGEYRHYIGILREESSSAFAEKVLFAIIAFVRCRLSFLALKPLPVQQNFLPQVTGAWKDQITTSECSFSFPNKCHLGTNAGHCLSIEGTVLLTQALDSWIT